ncbi:polyamine aminopropyltransferase [Nafulsella turpanensis]|uniref:polyamine aminopropyltransferase n=1 Tax=Nafulsella turpanensis TaxID=1265690 RepID=UPI00034A4A98|nr:polyamine aminopropyltransferase [Nafulsella turpanensis]
MKNVSSFVLKAALFATGLSGVVAEYVLSTLASYFIGDSTVQWALIISTMLFSMGFGSRLSKYFEENLLEKFIIIELLLTIFVSICSLLAFTAAAYTMYVGLIIYAMSILIGLLIGMEIPLVIRLNDEFEVLKVNVSSILEKDYYGSLLGGVFFAFVGLPYLGLTYTPFVLAAINFSVTVAMVGLVWKSVVPRVRLRYGGMLGAVAAFLLAGVLLAQPIVLYGEQRRYKDKIIFSAQSKYQKVVITQWQDDYWLFINGNQQLSTLDEAMYHEPLVHPAMKLQQQAKRVLVLGGGDGCAVREILKYSSVEEVKLVDLDPLMTDLGMNHPVLKELNQGALLNPKVEIINADGFIFLQQDSAYYDVIILDFPDPNNAELARLYSEEFYRMVHRRLKKNGVMVTQAGSPYFATRAFRCIDLTVQAAGFSTVPLHNQVVTLGEWGWILGMKEEVASRERIKKSLVNLEFKDVETRWINHEAMSLITSFGKDIYSIGTDSVRVNKVNDPVLYRYYLNGNWDLY